MNNTIYFDMDGTLANLYEVENWLNKLIIEDYSPYILAKPMLDLVKLSNLLITAKSLGYKIGIISWGSKHASESSFERIKLIKKSWLKKYLPNIQFDEILILDYSCNKASHVKDPFGILFDDDKYVRKFWPGKAYPPEQIFEVLENLIEKRKGNIN